MTNNKILKNNISDGLLLGLFNDIKTLATNYIFKPLYDITFNKIVINVEESPKSANSILNEVKNNGEFNCNLMKDNGYQPDYTVNYGNYKIKDQENSQKNSLKFTNFFKYFYYKIKDYNQNIYVNYKRDSIEITSLMPLSSLKNYLNKIYLKYYNN